MKMTHAEWVKMSEAEKAKVRDNGLLTKELIGLEGKRIEVVDCHGEKRRFWVGKSTGWTPVHLEIKTARSFGGQPVSGTPFKSVTILKGGKQ